MSTLFAVLITELSSAKLVEMNVFSAEIALKLAMIAMVTFAVLSIAACSDKPSGYVSIQQSRTVEAALFRQNCAICHGPEAEGKTLDDGRAIPNIRSGVHKYSTDQQIYEHITNGGNGMVPFRDILTERERNALVQFVQKELRGK